jgi:large subunit ribosomal protein L1
MAKAGKKFNSDAAKVDRSREYSLHEAVEVLKSFEPRKFDQTIETAVRINVDPRKADQMVRGSVTLPNGTGRTRTVLVFARGEAADAAKAAGADFIGAEDLVERVQGGWTEFDVAIATPDMMGLVGRLGRVLGPRGLMPNPKTGTVTADTAKAVEDAKGGKVDFRVDKNGNIHAPLGLISFDGQKIEQNAKAFFEALMRQRPATVKGLFVKSATISGTMTPGIRIDKAELLSAVS